MNRENNILIAEFMGGRIEEENGYFRVFNWSNIDDYPNKLVQSIPFTWEETKEKTLQGIYKSLSNSNYGRWGKFHSDWNHIMLVLEKIESLEISTTACKNCNHDHLQLKTYGSTRLNRYYARFESETSSNWYIADSGGNSKIEAVYNAVISFIKYYNENKKQS